MQANFANIVSTVALVASLLGLWLHWRKHVREISDRRPEVLWETLALRELPKWNILRITLRNRDNQAIKADDLTIIWPPTARLAGYWESTMSNGGDYYLVAPKRTFRKMPMGMRVAHAGKHHVQRPGGGPKMGSGDTHSEDFLLLGRPGSTVILRMRISSSSTSRRVRNSIIRAQIVAAEHPKSTKQATVN